MPRKRKRDEIEKDIDEKNIVNDGIEIYAAKRVKNCLTLAELYKQYPNASKSEKAELKKGDAAGYDAGRRNYPKKDNNERSKFYQLGFDNGYARALENIPPEQREKKRAENNVHTAINQGRSAVGSKDQSEDYQKAAVEFFKKQSQTKEQQDAARGKHCGYQAAKKGRDLPKTFSGESKVYVENFKKAFQKARKKMKPEEIDTARGKNIGHDIAKNGRDLPKSFPGKSPAYQKAFIEEFNKVQTEMSLEEIDTARGKKNGHDTAKKGWDLPKSFPGKSPTYQKAYIEEFQKVRAEMKPEEIDAARGKYNGYHAAKQGCDLPEAFPDKSPAYRKVYIEEFQKVRAKMSPEDIEAAKEKRHRHLEDFDTVVEEENFDTDMEDDNSDMPVDEEISMVPQSASAAATVAATSTANLNGSFWQHRPSSRPPKPATNVNDTMKLVV